MLDLEKLAPHMHALIARRQREAEELAAAGRAAAATLAGVGGDWPALIDRIEQANTSWLLAELIEDPTLTHPAPVPPEAYTVVATDGSQIAADRHEADGCAVVNIGKVLLRYGSEPAALLESDPQIVVDEDEVEPDGGGVSTPKPVLNLGLRRSMLELDALGALIADHSVSAPAVAMVDGTLIQWPLEGEEPDCRDVVMERVRTMLDVAQERRVAVVGYISRPGSRDVVNALRVRLCEYPMARCETYCADHPRPRRRSAPCGSIEMTVDRLLFARLLQPGERSARFRTRSKIEAYYEAHGCSQHRTCFCYVNAGSEVVRLEMPEWVATDEALLDLVHAVCLDQSEKGQGYPRALTEAHELAVVRGADRISFYETLERMLVQSRLPVVVTRKALAKRTRSV